MNKKLKVLFFISILIIFITFTLTLYNTFSLENNNYNFTTKIYNINNNYITNISANTTLDLFYKYFDLNNCTIEVTNTKGDKLAKTDFIFNGSKTILYDKNNNIINTYTNIIKGDIYQDGLINENDFQKFGEILVNNTNIEEYQKLSIDINNDSSIHQNDLLLLDKTISEGYKSISLENDNLLLQTSEQARLIAKITPNYGLNQNAKWISLDDNIATVDNSGIVTPLSEGTTTIQAITQDGKYIATATITVDNTIQIESTKGISYVGGNDLKVKIKAINYDEITCTPTNEEIATCSIEGEYLVMKAKKEGKTDIIVKSKNNGEVTFSLITYSTYLNVMPKYLCTTPSNINYITVSGFNTGELSFISTDNQIITNSYMDQINGRKMLRIEYGKTGRASLTLKESNGNATSSIVIDVTKMSLDKIGAVTKIGQEVSIKIIGENLGDLSCISNNEEIATCAIEEQNLIVTPLTTGNVTIDVYNKFTYNNTKYNCGNSQFIVVIEE